MFRLKWSNKFSNKSLRFSDCKCISIHRSPRKTFKALFCLLVCIELLYVSFIVGCGNDNKTKYQVWVDETNGLEEVSGERSEKGAIEAAKKFVVNSLESRKTAQFPRYNSDVIKQDENLYLIRSYVDTREDCGPKARRHYKCLLRFTEDKWVLEELTFF